MQPLILLVCVTVLPLVAMTLPARAMGDTAASGQEEGSEVRPLAEVPRVAEPPGRGQLRGVFFNPRLETHVGRTHGGELGGFPWLCVYPEVRNQVRQHLEAMASTMSINFVAVFVSMPYSLKEPSRPPREGQSLSEWANMSYLDNVADFIDDCYAAGISVEIELACNMWVPGTVDSEHHIANAGNWPMPDETPWTEAALWYKETITYIERRAAHPEAIAVWCMMGSYNLGEAEPCLWPDDSNPAVLANTEKCVKYVWPVFSTAGKRPKAPPIMLPIFSNAPYWMGKTAEMRLSAVANMKRWIVDDLDMPPDYWVFTAYPSCDPAPDGFHYLRRIMEILGPENADRIIATDLKGPGHEPEYKDTILSVDGYSGVDLLEWHFKKFEEYGIQNWWIWAYQDQPGDAPWVNSGIRRLNGEWKMDLVQALKAQAD